MNQLSKEDRAKVAESNKLIAEFMGWGDKVHHTISPSAPTDFRNDYKRFDSPDGKISLSYYWDDFTTSLPYHTSWDWLMPVVEKIEKEGCGEMRVRIHISRSQVHVGIYDSGGMSVPNPKLSFVVNGESKLHATYTAVIQFITWYNQNNQCK